MITADKVMSEEQLHRLLKLMKQRKDRSLAHIQSSRHRGAADMRNVTDYYFFSLIALTGLRVSEATHLLKTDLHPDFLVIRAEISKNGKAGTVYFGSKTRAIVEEFLEIKATVFKKDHWDFVFSLNGKVTSRSYMHTRFKAWVKSAGLPDSLSIHCLRHTYGTHCLDKGLSLTFVRDNLRHSNISITSQYLHLTKENREKVKELF